MNETNNSYLPRIFEDCSNESLYKQAIENWGRDAQMMMVVEELGELLTAMSHYTRGRITKEELAIELAAVAMMVDEALAVFDVSKELFNKCLQSQMEEFKKRLHRTSQQKVSLKNKEKMEEGPPRRPKCCSLNRR